MKYIKLYDRQKNNVFALTMGLSAIAMMAFLWPLVGKWVEANTQLDENTALAMIVVLSGILALVGWYLSYQTICFVYRSILFLKR